MTGGGAGPDGTGASFSDGRGAVQAEASPAPPSADGGEEDDDDGEVGVPSATVVRGGVVVGDMWVANLPSAGPTRSRLRPIITLAVISARAFLRART